MSDTLPGGPARLLSRLHPLDWTAAGLLAAGGLCLATGALPLAAASASVARLLPLLLFLGTVVLLAELTAAAGVFAFVANRVAAWGRGRFSLLFLLCVGLAATTTAVLNLDTTAVLLTPVLLALAAALGVPGLPLAMTTVWLANTASLLLPVSNLTNLLAADRVALAPGAFAARMWAPQLAAVAATALCLWVFYWRRGRRGADLDRYTPPAPAAPADPVLFRVAALACGLFVAAILLGAPIGVASTGAALVLLGAFALRDRGALHWGLLPVRLLAFVIGLFLVLDTVSAHGLTPLVQAAVGAGDDAAGALRTAATGAGLSNLVNNLPAYVAGETAVPAAHQTQLLALLIGTNVAPVVTPWASLATLLWYERCVAAGVRIPFLRFAGTGLVLAVVATGAAVGALLITR